jgi:hypothetical protein
MAHGRRGNAAHREPGEEIMGQPQTYACVGSSVYATTADNPQTTCNWSASVSGGSIYVSYTCTGNGGTDAPQTQTLSLTSPTPVSIDTTGGSGVTVDGTLQATVIDGSAFIIFVGVIVQANAVSIGCRDGNGLIVAACLADSPGNS